MDGSKSGEKALEFAKSRAQLIKNSKILICYVIEWSPFSFQTAEENEQRHKRREEEINLAKERILDPALSAVSGAGFTAEGIVKHGDAAEILDRIAKEHKAEQIIIGRVGAKGLKERLFGGVSGRLVATSSVPVTIIP
ncbi:universal stress protein [Sneathiella glossodoripedis]|uniref:universal stress protein n=1 Tax=Sneathiella glossodoripedis TaxID=418853 RepID=UPI00056AB5F6|nr:universal stress protein [Sneathiella glossodoripedis]